MSIKVQFAKTLLLGLQHVSLNQAPSVVHAKSRKLTLSSRSRLASAQLGALSYNTQSTKRGDCERLEESFAPGFSFASSFRLAKMSTCEGGNDYNGQIGVRISSIFVILVGSFLGTWFPVFAARHKDIGVPGWAFFIAKVRCLFTLCR